MLEPFETLVWRRTLQFLRGALDLFASFERADDEKDYVRKLKIASGVDEVGRTFKNNKGYPESSLPRKRQCCW